MFLRRSELKIDHCESVLKVFSRLENSLIGLNLNEADEEASVVHTNKEILCEYEWDFFLTMRKLLVFVAITSPFTCLAQLVKVRGRCIRIKVYAAPRICEQKMTELRLNQHGEVVNGQRIVRKAEARAITCVYVLSDRFVIFGDSAICK